MVAYPQLTLGVIDILSLRDNAFTKQFTINQWTIPLNATTVTAQEHCDLQRAALPLL